MPKWKNLVTGDVEDLTYDEAHERRRNGIDIILQDATVTRHESPLPKAKPPLRGMKAKLNREQNGPGAASHAIRNA
jgi:hypothetical protein